MGITNMKKLSKLGFAALAGVAAIGMSLSTPAMAEEDEMEPPAAAVFKYVIDSGVKISYDRVADLMRADNAFGEGAACINCHNGAKAQGGLDLSTCDTIKKGGVSGPFVVPGSSSKGTLKRSLRDNRMPLGVAFDYPNNTKNHMIVYDWIKDGAKNDANFNNVVLPLFDKPDTFGNTGQSCVDCHMSNEEPPSFHEMDMTTWEGIVVKGADSVAKAAEGLPPVMIVIPGKPEESKLWLRIAENRMPQGIAMDADRDPYNMHILMAWAKQGANCN